jgi:hypothetical protein
LVSSPKSGFIRLPCAGLYRCAPGTPSQASRPDHVAGENPKKLSAAHRRDPDRKSFCGFSGPARFGISIGDAVAGDVILNSRSAGGFAVAAGPAIERREGELIASDRGMFDADSDLQYLRHVPSGYGRAALPLPDLRR